MGVRFQIDSKAVHDEIVSLMTKSDDVRPALQQFGRWATRRKIPENFERSVDAYGKRWAALAPATLTPERLTFGTKPLVKTKKLKNSFRYRTSKKEVKLFNTQPYFKFHQSRAPRKRLPRRAALPDVETGIPKSWTDRFKEELEVHFR